MGMAMKHAQIFLLIPLLIFTQRIFAVQQTCYQGSAADHLVISEGLNATSTFSDVAVDWQQNSHVVWRSGRDIYYAKTDLAGNWMLQENQTPVPFRKVGTLSTATFVPSIAVDYDGAAHIVAANGIGSMFYLKITADGTELLREAKISFKVNLNWVYFQGADVAIDPKTNLPVIGTLGELVTPTTIWGYPMTKHQERIYAVRLNENAEITEKIFFAASGWSLGCPRYIYGHPAISVDNNGIVHAVWKTRMLVSSEEEDKGTVNQDIIGGTLGIVSTNSAPDPNASLAEKFQAENRHGVSYSEGDIMIEYARSDKVQTGLGLLIKFGGVYVNTPGDIMKGTYYPVPRIACDDEDRVHIAWNGKNGDKPAILYSRIWLDPEEKQGIALNQAMNMGVIEKRSYQINSSLAEVEEEQCDLAIGDNAVHFVWVDGRNSQNGSQIFHGAVSLLSGILQSSQEYAISGKRDNNVTLPHIAFRTERIFKQWIGYDGDPNPGAEDFFNPAEAETAVNLYPNKEIRLTATYLPWPNGTPCPPDPEINLSGNPQGASYERVYLSADDGCGQYTVTWQEMFPEKKDYDICLHRRRYWAQTYGLLPHSEQPNRLWDSQDARDALSEANRTQGTVVDLPIVLRPVYADLVQESNYHEAQGLVADGVTPFIIRVDLPVGEYYIGLAGAPSSNTGGVAGFIGNQRLFRFYFSEVNPDWCNFEQTHIGNSFTVSSEHPGLQPKETIFLIKGFDCNAAEVSWPAAQPDLVLQLKLWKRPANTDQGLDMTKDEPFAMIPFGVARPPIILVHGFNNAGSGWTAEFKKPLEDLVGKDMLFSLDYAQSMSPYGPLATWEKHLESSVNSLLKRLRWKHGSDYIDERLEYKMIRDDALEVKKQLDEVKKTIEEGESLLRVLGYLGGEDPEEEIDWLDWTIKVLYWQKAANATDDLTTLEKELALNLYATEQLLRHRSGWAFTRYDVIGHCQGAILLRMLATNAKTEPEALRFLQMSNFGRGRFRSLTAIGAPFRGSKLTQYYRHYYNHVTNTLATLIENYEYRQVLSTVTQNLGAGLGLLYYADRHGYMEPKFDAFNGEVMTLAEKYPVHPSAKFHYVSTVIDHDAKVPWHFFASIGLVKNSPQPDFELFDLLYPPFGTTKRFSDGLVGWRSHLAGLNYQNQSNQPYMTFLDELTTGNKAFAAHVPPFSMKAFFEIEDPSAPSIAEMLACIKDSIQAGMGDKDGWKNLLKRFGEEMLKKMLKNHDVLFSPFGTFNTQTGLELIGQQLAEEILNKPINQHFTRHIEYNPSLPQGEGNPENWGSLADQEITISAAVQNRLEYYLAQSQQWDFLTQVSSRSALEPGVYRYQLHLPEEITLSTQADPPVIWSISVQNELLCTTMDVDVVPDTDDPCKVTITIGEDVLGTVLLNCAFFTEAGRLVQLSPLVLATVGLGEITGIHFSTWAPVLNPGEKVFLMLDAEYMDGFYGPLFPAAGQALIWNSSDPEVASVQGGLLTAGNRAGISEITVSYGDFATAMTVQVAGQAPTVTLLPIADPLDFNGGDGVLLQATAEDDGEVINVVFFANGLFAGEGVLEDGVYRFTWNDLQPGSYELQAAAVDNDQEASFSNIMVIEVANRNPVITGWSSPLENTWYGGNIYCSAEAHDPDGDALSVQFEFSLDGIHWAQCYYSLTLAPFDCNWNSLPREDIDDEVWLRVQATDARGGTSETLTRKIKIDNSSSGLTFTPHPGETNVPLNVQPTIAFDNPISKPDGSTLNNADLPAYFGLFWQGLPIACTLSINTEKTLMTLAPSEPLRGVTPCTISILSEIKDSSGTIFRQTNATFVTTFGTPAGLEFRNLSATGEAGRPLDTPIRVHVVDAWSNTITDAELAVTVASGDQAALNGTLTKNAVHGVAVFDDLNFTLAGQRQLTASATGLNGDSLTGIRLRPSALARLEVTLSTATAVAGTRLSATVSAFDQFDNPKTDYNGIPLFSSSDSAAQLPGPYAFYETDNGLHSYRNTLLFKTLGNQTVQVRDGSVVSPQASITVTNAAPLPPELLSPENGGFTGLLPTLQLGKFTDVDNAGHGGTEIQVATTEAFEDNDLVWNSTQLPPVLNIPLPPGILAEFTAYFWRARVKDLSGDPETEWSEWAQPAQFRTAYAFPFQDNFSVNLGWQGLSEGGWSIAPAQSGGGEYGNPDPGDDITPDNNDRGILGYVIGGDYLPGREATVVSPPVDCSEAQIVELSFWRWLGIENNDWAHASVAVSADGQDWQEVWANSATDTEDEEWHPIVFDLTPWAAGQATVFIAFRINSVEEAFPFCAWNVDDLKLGPAAEKLAGIFLQVDNPAIEVGDIFNVDIYVQEDHPEAAGLLGAAVRLDFTQGLSSYWGSSTVANCVLNPPWNLLRRGVRVGNILTELAGLTNTTGSGNGQPVLLARVPMKAITVGNARFECTPAAAFALPTPFGQIGPWRVSGAVLEINIAADALMPLAQLTLSGPSAPVALGNTFQILVYAEEKSAEARGFLGGPFDLYFDPIHVSAPDFSADTAIQAPYTDEALGLVSGTLLENRIDELGGATVQTGHGNNSKVLYAVLSFRADSLGESIFEAKAGSSGLTLTTPVGQLPFSRINYGLPFVVDIRPNFTISITGGIAGAINCYEGQVIELAAGAPQPGWQFSYWDGDENSLGSLSNTSQTLTSLTVPGAPVSLTAVYRKIDYSLTVTGGIGSATPVHIGEQFEISANPPATGKEFETWTGDTQYLENPAAASTTVTIATANVTVTATYQNIRYRVEISNGSGDTEAAIYAQPLAISADPAPLGYVFAGWGGTEQDLECLWSRYAASTTLLQPAHDIHVTASYSAIDYPLTVNQGSGSKLANYQDEVQIAADTALIGQIFSHWSGDTACLNDVFAAEAMVTMPAAPVTLTAVFKMVNYTLLVVNGSGSGTYTYGSQVAISADPAPLGTLGFSSWSGHVGTLATPSQSSTTLTMPAAHTAVVAIYGDSSEINTFELALKKGWNCIAVPFETANPIGTLDSKGNLITMIWSWDGMFIPPLKPDGTIANTIQPHIGHWIFCPDDCRLTFERWQE